MNILGELCVSGRDRSLVIPTIKKEAKSNKPRAPIGKHTRPKR
jgi:hypothetical protein